MFFISIVVYNINITTMLRMKRLMLTWMGQVVTLVTTIARTINLAA